MKWILFAVLNTSPEKIVLTKEYMSEMECFREQQVIRRDVEGVESVRCLPLLSEFEIK